MIDSEAGARVGLRVKKISSGFDRVEINLCGLHDGCSYRIQ